MGLWGSRNVHFTANERSRTSWYEHCQHVPRGTGSEENPDPGGTNGEAGKQGNCDENA